ncbi:hypothetical protein [Amycolatopsis marina]|nr:hypothetical protein [Amycolatopsis marina]
MYLYSLPIFAHAVTEVFQVPREPGTVPVDTPHELTGGPPQVSR